MMFDPRPLDEYQAWSWTRVLSDCRKLTSEQLCRPGIIAGGNGDGSLSQTISHNIFGDDVWLRRMQGDPKASMQTTIFTDVESLAAARADVDRRLFEFGRGLGPNGVQQEFTSYRRQLDQNETLPLWQMMAHLAMHSMQHRAEACVGLTALGISPQPIDLIEYYRTGGK